MKSISYCWQVWFSLYEMGVKKGSIFFRVHALEVQRSFQVNLDVHVFFHLFTDRSWHTFYQWYNLFHRFELSGKLFWSELTTVFSCFGRIKVQNVSLRNNYILFPTGIYLFKINNRNSRTICKICSKLAIKTTERRQ